VQKPRVSSGNQRKEGKGKRKDRAGQRVRTVGREEGNLGRSLAVISQIIRSL
jgi:hypothetical protein